MADYAKNVVVIKEIWTKRDDRIEVKWKERDIFEFDDSQERADQLRNARSLAQRLLDTHQVIKIVDEVDPPEKPTLIMWIEDLTVPGKARVCMGKSGYPSVKAMQDELIRRRPRIDESLAFQGYTTEAIDRIHNVVIVWKWYWAMEQWHPIQKITLEEPL